jgi:hypothetical protein
LGLPFCGSGSPVYGCSTIGLAHSRNLLVLKNQKTLQSTAGVFETATKTCAGLCHFFLLWPQI